MEQHYKSGILSALGRYCDLLDSHSFKRFEECVAEEQIEAFLLENAILQAFGLPDKVKNHLLIYNLAKTYRNNPLKEDELFYELSVRAEEYLSSRPKTVKQLLSLAKEHRKNPFDVLPELETNVNSYTLYIYNEILLKNKAPDVDVLEEFTLLKKLNCLSYIYLLCFDKNYKENPVFADLQNSGLKYLTSYLQYYHRGRKKSLKSNV